LDRFLAALDPEPFAAEFDALVVAVLKKVLAVLPATEALLKESVARLHLRRLRGASRPTPAASGRIIAAGFRPAAKWNARAGSIRPSRSRARPYPPEENAEVKCQVEVGDAANHARLEATFKLEPHFRLTRQGGGANFQVNPGNDLVLECTDGMKADTVTLTPAADVEISKSGAAVTLKVKATAAVGPRQVLVSAAGNPQRKARRTIQIT